MANLVGWEETSPSKVKKGQEVCFARNWTLRDEGAILSFDQVRYGRPVMFMVYGRVASNPLLVDVRTRPTKWSIEIEVMATTAYHVQGFSAEVRIGRRLDDGTIVEEDDEALPRVHFGFNFDETLTVVRHDGTRV